MSRHTVRTCDKCGRKPPAGRRFKVRSDGTRYCPDCKVPVVRTEHDCGQCSETKPIDQFYLKRDGSVSGPCKSCILSNSRLAKYGISEEQFQGMLLAQDGRCAICDAEMSTPYLDHCHESGKPRGLLCRECNTGLGMFADSPQRLIRAAGYLMDQGGKS